MIRKYVIGEPIETDAVVLPMEAEKLLTLDDIPYLSVSAIDSGSLAMHCAIDSTDIVYGLGEMMHGINKRGYRYVSYNTDDPHHRDDMLSMYGAHNFVIISGKDTFGFFIDTPSRVRFDIDVEQSGSIDILAETDSLKLYLINGGNAYDIIKQFLHMIGKSHVPPLYAFGYGQSRWGYMNEKDIRRVVDGYEKIGVPLDYVCLDIDYMDRYIDFTVNKKRFPNITGFIQEMRGSGIHLVPIIDAGVKVEPGNPVYEEGVKNGFFCTGKSGKPFGAAVWPGMTHFPDFFQPEARAWFGSKYKFLTDLGFDGFWNDMNEPAIFYTEETGRLGWFGMLKQYLFPQKAEAEGAAAAGESNAYKGYRQFYHLVDGKRVLHHKIHNLYGAFMTRAAGEFLNRELDGKYFLFSRSSYIGAHRYGGIWTGDNNSSWHMLRQNLSHMANLNMVGFIYSGADTGGFGGNCDRELLLRWLALSVWTPLMRNHSAKGTKEQECYQFSKPEDFRTVIGFRYRILPYLYESFLAAAEDCDMFMRPLAFEFTDEHSKKIEDQLIVGKSVMIAPIIDEADHLTGSRSVFLPEAMTEVRYNGNSFRTEKKQAGDYTVQMPVNEVVFYIRDGHKVKVANKQVMHTKDLDLNDTFLLG